MKKRSYLVREIVEVLVLTVCIFLVIHFIIQSYHIDGVSMEPGLNSQELVVVNKTAYLFHQPQRGDVIVFHYPVDPRQDFIKRIIGLPGDTIQTNFSQVWVNGVKLNESAYISAPANLTAQKWTVPKNDYFVMGDNRPKSDDSRSWGFVPMNNIVGKTVVVYWPISDWEFINTYPSTYTQISSAH
ncbi:MAG TPA: signal peptidase I [Ktedonobacteraceae bacterium]|nr:signal peptidase I [Ktedonobacteraceae bacterium]